jgi:hypothetical protein
VLGDKSNNGNLVGMLSNYKTEDGKSHEMADVWFAKDRAPAPKLDDVLSAPQADVLPASTAAAADAPAATPAAHAHAAVPFKAYLLDDDKQVPLI